MNNSLFDAITYNANAIDSLIADFGLPFYNDREQELAASEIGANFELFEFDMSEAERDLFYKLPTLEKALKYFETIGYPPPPTDESTTFLGFDMTGMIISFAMYKNRSARSILLLNLQKDSSWLNCCEATTDEATELIHSVRTRQRHGQALVAKRFH